MREKSEHSRISQPLFTPALLRRYQACSKQAKHSLLRQQQETVSESMLALGQAAKTLNAEADNYGTGGLVTQLEQRVANLLGCQAALFLPSGTLAQPLALRIHADHRKGNAVALHATSHLLLHEQDGYRELWRLKAHSYGNRFAAPSHAEVLAAQRHDIAAMVWELPMRELGGVLPSFDELVAQTSRAKAQGIATHLDGARLWQCEPALGSLQDICRLFDSVYVSFYKDLNGIAGAMLLGSEAFIGQARIWNRRAGGNLPTLYPLALAAWVGLDTHLPNMPRYVDYAGRLANALGSLSGVSVVPKKPQAAMFHLHIDLRPEPLLRQICRHLDLEGVLVLPAPRLDVNGQSVCELSVGASALKQDVSFWQAQLAQLLVADDG